MHTVIWLLGLHDQVTWPYLLWSGFGAFIAALLDFGLIFTLIHHVRAHRREVREHHALLAHHHALLEDHHRTLLLHLIGKEVSV